MKPIASRITIAVVITACILVVSSIAPSMMMVYGATNCTATMERIAMPQVCIPFSRIVHH